MISCGQIMTFCMQEVIIGPQDVVIWLDVIIFFKDEWYFHHSKFKRKSGTAGIKCTLENDGYVAQSGGVVYFFYTACGVQRTTLTRT